MDRPGPYEDTTAVGVDVLGLVTSGMYIDPLSVYREYIQNAADAIESAGSAREGRVELTLLPQEGRIAIADNGPGLSLAEARRSLVPIARSEKRGRGLRGFRGVGRLAGLAFAESVTFLTRAGAGAPVARVVWDGNALNAGIARGEPLATVLDATVTVDTVSSEGCPAHFFEVHIEGVSRHAAGSLMNRDAARQYVAEVCPVPFSKDFLTATRIWERCRVGNGPFSLNVCFRDEVGGVERPHARSVRVSEHESQEIVELEEVRVAGLGACEFAAAGWIAHTPYRGAILKSCGVRGIRARVGNIQIGGENVFGHLFSEDRFNRWCIGEVHVLDAAIVPNARRDYFEPNVHLRNLENQLGAVCRRLEKRCRSASRDRLGERRVGEFVDEAEAALELAVSGYLNTDAAQRLVEDCSREAADWMKRRSTLVGGATAKRELGRVADRLNDYQAAVAMKALPGVGLTDAQAYRDVFGVLTEVLSDPRLAKRMIEAVVEGMENRRGKGGVQAVFGRSRRQSVQS